MCLNICVFQNTGNDQMTWIKFVKAQHEWTKGKFYGGDLKFRNRLIVICNGDVFFLLDVFTQISEASGLLNISRFESYLRELLIVSISRLDLLYRPRSLCFSIEFFSMKNSDLSRN